MTITAFTRFIAPDGTSFVYLADKPTEHGQVLFSPDGGATYYECAIGGFVGSERFHTISIAHPHDDSQWSSRLKRIDDVLMRLDNEGDVYVRSYQLFDLSQATIVPLPDIEDPVQLSYYENEEAHFFVAQSRYIHGPASFQFYSGRHYLDKIEIVRRGMITGMKVYYFVDDEGDRYFIPLDWESQDYADRVQVMSKVRMQLPKMIGLDGYSFVPTGCGLLVKDPGWA